MRIFNNITQGVSTLLIFILLIQLSGCYSTRQISASDLTNSDQYFYAVHKGDKTFQLIGVSIINGTLSGLVTAVKPIKDKLVDLYVSSDYPTEIMPDKYFSINLTDISRIELRKSNTAGNIFLGLVGFIGLVAIIGILSFETSPVSIGW